MLTETYKDRLKNWFDPNHYKVLNSSGCISIERKEQDHFWKLDCYIENEALLFRLEKEYALKYLQQKKVADAVILEILKPETVKLHIFECKKTVRHSSWDTIKSQFEGALLNALGLLGVLGVPSIDSIVFYTAYLNDRLSPKDDPAVSLYKGGAGKRIHKTSLDWLEDHISVLSIASAPHLKIQLVASGDAINGRIDLK